MTAVVEVLLAEIQAYLEAVDLFRRAGYEPLWLPERRTGSTAL